MDLNKFRIGYVPCSRKLDFPGDKLSFCHYANKRNIKFEIADPSKDYDLVIITERGDKSIWSRYRKGSSKIVYVLMDSYLAIPWYDPKGALRGLAKYISRESRYPQLNYWNAIKGMCQRSDAVICSTEEQRHYIIKFCKNVHVVLDFTHSVVRKVKVDYSSGDVFNFVWAGLPCNIGALFEVRDVLRQLKQKYKIALHIVTNLKYYKYLGKYWPQSAVKATRRLFDNVHLYEWDDMTCATIITGCDLALIPLPINNSFAIGKPENKLLLFWRMGMPTVVSATPAYLRAMQRCGLPMVCRTKSDWLEILEKYMKDKDARAEAGEHGRAFAEKYYNEEKILSQWDDVFKSIM